MACVDFITASLRGKILRNVGTPEKYAWLNPSIPEARNPTIIIDVC